MLEELYYMVWLGCVATVFSHLLIIPGNIFGFYGRWLARLPEWLGNPLGECGYCFAGQLALWSYFFIDLNLVKHIFFIVGTIFFYHLISYVWEKLSD